MQTRQRGNIAAGAENHIVAGSYSRAGKVFQGNEELLSPHALQLGGGKVAGSGVDKYAPSTG